MIKKLFLLLFIAMGLTTSAQTAQGLVDKGVEYYEVGDYTNAVKYFQQGAEQGDADAQFYLGVCYYFGLGVPQSYTEAVKWLKKAAKQGCPQAIEVLKQLGEQ